MAQDHKHYWYEVIGVILGSTFAVKIASTILLAVIGTATSVVASLLLTPLFKKLFRKWKLLK